MVLDTATAPPIAPPPPSQDDGEIMDDVEGEQPPEEETEATPEDVIDDPEVAAAARAEVEDQREEIRVETGYDCIIAMIADVRGAEGHPEMIDAAARKCVELFGMTEEMARNRVENVDKFLDTLKVQTVGVELGSQELARLQQILCEPLLRGHMSAEALGGLARLIQVRPAADLLRAGEDNDIAYPPVMASDGLGHIMIAQEALSGEMKAEDQSELDLPQILNHEVGHTAVRDIFMTPDQEGGTEAMEAGKAFTNEVIALAQQAKEDRIPQPRHVEMILETLSRTNIEARYNAKTPEDKQSQSLEDFQKEQEAYAAEEILADYTAVFLQSDGTRPGFMSACLSKIDQVQFTDYLTSEMPADGAEEGLTQQLAEILAKPNNEGVEILRTDPRFAKMRGAFEMYDRFFDIAHKYLTDSKIQAAAAKRMAREDEFEYDAYGDYYRDSGEGHGTYAGKGHTPEGTMGDLANATGQAFKNFADGVNILASVSTPAAGL